MIEVYCRSAVRRRLSSREISEPSDGLRSTSSASVSLTSKPTTARPSSSSTVIVSNPFLIAFDGARMDSTVPRRLSCDRLT